MTTERPDVWDEIGRTAPGASDDATELTATLVREVEELANELLLHPATPKDLREIINKVRVDAVELTDGGNVTIDISRENKPEIIKGRIAYGFKPEIIKRRIAYDLMLLSHVREFISLLPKNTTYRSVEFQCVADFDKCNARRGRADVLCALALFICIARRIIPFIRS